MRRSILFACFGIAHCCLPQIATKGAEITVEAVVRAVEPNDRTVVVEKSTTKGSKELSLEVAKEAGDIASLKVGDKVVFKYDSTLETIVEILYPQTATPPRETTSQSNPAPISTPPQEDNGEQFGRWETLDPAVGVPRVVVYKQALTGRTKREIDELKNDHLSGLLLERLGGTVVTEREDGVILVPPQKDSTFYVPVLIRPRKAGAIRINFTGEKGYGTTSVTASFAGKALSDGTTVVVQKDVVGVLLFVVKVNSAIAPRCHFRFEITDEKGGGIDVHIP